MILSPLFVLLYATVNEVQYEGGETYAQEENRDDDDEPYDYRRIM